MAPARPRRQHHSGAAGAGRGDDGSSAGPGPSSSWEGPAGLHGVLVPLLDPLLRWGALCRDGLRALRAATPAARDKVDATIRSLDLRGVYGEQVLQGQGAFVARLQGLQELRADAATLSLTRVVAGRSGAAGVRSVHLSVAADGSVDPGLCEMLRSAFHGLQVRCVCVLVWLCSGVLWAVLQGPLLGPTAEHAAHTGWGMWALGRGPLGPGRGLRALGPWPFAGLGLGLARPAPVPNGDAHTAGRRGVRGA